MIYTLASIFDIGVSIEQALRSLAGFIAGYIYNFIISIYNIFEILAKADFLDSKFVNQIYTKVGLILGLFMVFKLSFVLVQSLIDPSKLTDKKNGIGSIIGRVVVSIVLLGITPTIFKEAFRLQNLLIGSENSDNIIYKLIIGNSVSNREKFGTILAKDLFFEFYTDNDDPKYDGGIKMFSSIQTSEGKTVDYGTYIKSYTYDSIKDEVSENNEFDSTSYYLALTDPYGRYYIEFNILGSWIAGLVIAWILLSFCIQIGVRVFKLAFLQLIAPIPILSYISDPDGSFKKWLQQCGITFLDLFIRLVIIYFVIYFSKNVLEQVENLKNEVIFGNDSAWVKVFLIIGLLMFAKRVPELLKDIFPGNGKFDLGIKSPKKLWEEIPGKGLAAGTGLAAAGTVVSGISRFKSNKAAGKGVGKSMLGAAYGVGAGLFNGGKAGLTKKGLSGGWKNIQESNNKYNKLITSGGTTLGTIRAKVGDTFGESKGQEFTRLMANYQKVIDDNKYVNDVAEEFSEVKQLKTRWETLRMSGASEAEINAAWDTYKSAKKAALTAALSGSNTFTYAVTSVRNVGGIPMISVDPNGGSGDLSSFENAAYAGQIKVRRNDTEDFINSHNVKLKDSHGNDITSFSSAEVFKDASVNATSKQTEILSNNDFGAAIANDDAAGIDSHKTARKDK